MTDEIFDLLVIGGGPAGLTAALYAHRAGLSVLALGGDTPGGQVTRHLRVENFPGYPGGVTGAELMMKWLQQVIDEIGDMPRSETVTEVDLFSPLKTLFSAGGSYRGRTVIVATGSRPKRINVPGEEELAGNGVFSCATCDGPLLRRFSRRRAAVVGGGDTAVHTALALLPHADNVTVLARGSSLKAQPWLQERLMAESRIRVLPGCCVTEIMGEGCVTGITVVHAETGVVETLPLDAVFVGVGQEPVTDFLKGSLRLNEEGFIITDDTLETSVAGVFAAGDVRATRLRQIITAAADGAVAAQSAVWHLRMHQPCCAG